MQKYIRFEECTIFCDLRSTLKTIFEDMTSEKLHNLSSAIPEKMNAAQKLKGTKENFG